MSSFAINNVGDSGLGGIGASLGGIGAGVGGIGAGVGVDANAGLGASAGLGGMGGTASQAAAAAQTIASAAEADSFESKLRSAMTQNNEAELKNACVQFEELMLGILYKSMKATIQRSDLTEASPGRDIYEQWQDDALMGKIAERGTFGLADMMYKQLSHRMKNAYELIED